MVYLPLVGLVALLIMSVADLIQASKKAKEAEKEKEAMKAELERSRADMDRLLKGIGEIEARYQVDIVREAMEVTSK
jgi:hypothetical protein